MKQQIPTMPHCGKCHLAQFGHWVPKAIGVHEQAIQGCRKLTKEQWDEGWRDDEDGRGFFQRNCPLLGIVRVSDETRCV